MGHGEVGGTWGGGWGHPQGDMHVVAAKLDCQNAIWLGLVGPIPALAAWIGLENSILAL